MSVLIYGVTSPHFPNARPEVAVPNTNATTIAICGSTHDITFARASAAGDVNTARVEPSTAPAIQATAATAKAH
jgi:hypothetical protein